MQRLLLLSMIFLGLSLKSFAVYDLNDRCKEAWVLLMDLDIEAAKKTLEKEIETNPTNYYAYYLEQTCDAYALIINSEDKDYERFIANYQKHRSIMDGQDTDSPYYLACYAEMELQLGIFNILKDSRLSGLRKAYSAYKKTYKNLKQFPDCKQSLKLDGFFNVAISNIPPFVKWAVSFFGVSSNPAYGSKLIMDNYQAQKDIKGINVESALFVILAGKLNKSPETSYQFLQSLNGTMPDEFIIQYFKANIAYRTGRNEEALAVLKPLEKKKGFYREIIYHYMMGKILIRKLNDRAEHHLQQYLAKLKKQEYQKEINYKLSVYYLIHGDEERYHQYCQRVLKEGIDVNERDREAIYDAGLKYTPHIQLTKARLLLSGGYIKKADSILKENPFDSSDLLAHQLEYHFLEGKTEMLRHNDKEALKAFEEVIHLGSKEDYYFASESALLIGRIHQQKGHNEQAKEYYELCIKLFDSDYYEYIEDAAHKALTNIEPQK